MADKTPDQEQGIQEATTVIASALTPTSSKDANLTAHIDNVDTALKGRAAATKLIKTRWAACIAVLNKYEATVPARRPQADSVYQLRNNITIMEVKPETPADIMVYVNGTSRYDVQETINNASLIKLLDKEFTGLSDRLQAILDGFMEHQRSPEENKAATKEARLEYDKVAAKYIEAIEAYDETVESVAGVKEYIGIMKDVADISAIAQGLKSHN